MRSSTLMFDCAGPRTRGSVATINLFQNLVAPTLERGLAAQKAAATATHLPGSKTPVPGRGRSTQRLGAKMSLRRCRRALLLFDHFIGEQPKTLTARTRSGHRSGGGGSGVGGNADRAEIARARGPRVT